MAACDVDNSSDLSQIDDSATIQSLTKADLQFVLTSANVTVRSGALGDDLYRAHVTYSSGNKPTITFDRTNGTLHLAQPPRTASLIPQNDHGSIEVTVSVRIPWTIDVTGGNFNTSLNLEGGSLKGVKIKGGSMRLDFSLPRPGGTVPVTVEGGSMAASVRIPAAAAAGVVVKGGQSKVQVDGQENEMNGGTLQMATPGYNSAADKYELSFSGGSTRLSVSRG